MIVDAIVKVFNLDKNNKRIDIYSPKFKFGRPLISIPSQYEGRPVKLVTSWSDIPSNPAPEGEGYGAVCINGSPVKDIVINNDDHLSFGMYVTCFGNDTIYVYMPEHFII